MHVHLRILRIYFLRYQESSHPENFHQLNSPHWWIPPGKFPRGLFQPMFLNIPARVFYFFFSILLPPSLILLKRLFCNSMFPKCRNLHVFEKLSKRSVKWRKTNDEMDGNIPGENFLGSNFMGEGFQGGLWWMGIFRIGIPSGRIFLGPFSSYNISVLIFQKIIDKYNKTFSKRTCTQNK